ncbi:DUF898 family protein [Anianabacter salinae]|uniref:DUF898 family protein n=1 Tax=Anianabacter salinae TaxID=2851023 RepID=UPI00225DFE45|nr:DUF898 family protein [Anianabacter salinae]MBV0913178.1 DUF898 domain-containing protein [Anianabacter salinae]
MDTATLHTDFAGRRGPLFGLALRTAVLTILTLGIYRFWMKTRLRRYYWSSIRPGGLPLEYAGMPLEKLLGFLIAVVFLAFYIGIVNLILMFASFAILHGNVTAYALSFVGVIPVIFYARYRARRYVLARTRWRGIRFGVEPGAWGYALRALWHWLLTLLTLGLYWPRKTFWLEKYRTDRTYFGTQPLVQGGRWTMLIRPFLPLVAGVAGTALLGLAAAGGGLPLLLGLFVTVPLTLYGLAHWNVHAFRRLTNAKTGGPVRFEARPRVWRVLRIYAVGWMLIALAYAALLTLFAVVLGALTAASGSFAAMSPNEIIEAIPRWAAVLLGVAAYFSVFLTYGVLAHVFLRLPIWRHYAETLTIHGADAILPIGQRARDEMERAEGLAEALDLGAAI